MGVALVFSGGLLAASAVVVVVVVLLLPCCCGAAAAVLCCAVCMAAGVATPVPAVLSPPHTRPAPPRPAPRSNPRWIDTHLAQPQQYNAPGFNASALGVEQGNGKVEVFLTVAPGTPDPTPPPVYPTAGTHLVPLKKASGRRWACRSDRLCGCTGLAGLNRVLRLIPSRCRCPAAAGRCGSDAAAKPASQRQQRQLPHPRPRRHTQRHGGCGRRGGTQGLCAALGVPPSRPSSLPARPLFPFCRLPQFHLHGHHFWVLGTGLGHYDPATAALNTANPPLRDTATLPQNGWVVLRFVADNPGLWIFHCHLLWCAGAAAAPPYACRACWGCWLTRRDCRSRCAAPPPPPKPSTP